MTRPTKTSDENLNFIVVKLKRVCSILVETAEEVDKEALSDEDMNDLADILQSITTLTKRITDRQKE